MLRQQRVVKQAKWKASNSRMGGLSVGCWCRCELRPCLHEGGRAMSRQCQTKQRRAAGNAGSELERPVVAIAGGSGSGTDNVIEMVREERRDAKEKTPCDGIRALGSPPAAGQDTGLANRASRSGQQRVKCGLAWTRRPLPKIGHSCRTASTCEPSCNINGSSVQHGSW